MKSFLLLTFSLIPFFLQALEFKIEPSNELILLDSNAMEIKRYKPGVVDEMIEADNQKFNLSYGEDVNGLMMGVITPANDNPTDISVKVNAVVPAGVTAIEAGLLAKIQVNDKTIAAGTRWQPTSQSQLPYQIKAGKNAIVTIYWRTLNTPAPSVLTAPPTTPTTNNIVPIAF